MRSDAPAPYSRRRALWTGMRLYARWIIWSYQLLAMFGQLSKRGRWLAREMGKLEHGLRCMLIIGAQRLTPPQPSPSSDGRRTGHAETSCSLVGRIGLGAFSFSLRKFVSEPVIADAKRLKNQRPIAPAPAPIADDGSETLAQHLETILDVFEQSDAYTHRMATHLARCGIKLRKPLAQRPCGVARPDRTDAAPRAPICAIPFLDSS